MPTNQTANYQLNQWVKSDRIMMDDFNADNTKIDAALKANADAVVAEALERAKCGNCRLSLMTYTGSGKYNDTGNETKITFSTMPDLFIIFGGKAILFGRGGADKGCGMFKDALYSGSFVSDTDLSWSGRQLSMLNSVHARYQMNEANVSYLVLAFDRADQ